MIESEEKGRNHMYTFQLKLKEIKQKIKKWNQEEFRHILNDQHQRTNKMQDLQQNIINQDKSEDLLEEEGWLIN